MINEPPIISDPDTGTTLLLRYAGEGAFDAGEGALDAGTQEGPDGGWKLVY